MLSLHAPAKLNLTLRVGPPRSDGRHDLDSLVCFTHRLGDRLEVSLGQGLELTLAGPFASGLVGEADNLVLRAARLLAAAADIEAHAHLHLVKNLPLASGIGGGSADAAATLHGLNRLWKLGLPMADLMAMAGQLGADVPACVLGQPAHMTGTGEEMAALAEIAGLGIVLVNPGVACPTGPVYRRFDELGAGPALTSSQMPDLSSPSKLLAYMAATPNDLEAAAVSLVPEIGETLTLLQESPGVRMARMSGSGATCFGLYDDVSAAQVARAFMVERLANPRFWVEADEINARGPDPAAGEGPL